jgi:hypothetical protein
MAQSVHRASGLKQQNKKHNKLGHKTKGQIKSLSQGEFVMYLLQFSNCFLEITSVFPSIAVRLSTNS